MVTSLILVVAVIVLLIVIANFVMSFTNARTISQIVEYNEAEYARQEMLERTVGIDKKSQEILVKVMMHCARNKIGTAMVIEGKTPLSHIEESGDTSGIIDITEPILKTLVESPYTSKGAILLRKNKIVAFNGKMLIDESRREENRKLIDIGLGSRHVGAYGEVRNNPGTVVVTVSEETGKISLFGHLSGKMSAEVSLDLKEFSIRGGVSRSELEYRLNDLLTGQGLDAALESDEIAQDMELKKETSKQRKARKLKEKELEKAKRKAEREQKEKENARKKEEERRAKSKIERGRFYDNSVEESPKGGKGEGSQSRRRQRRGDR